MKHQLILTCCLGLAASSFAAETISKRASEIDPRAKEHPEIDYVFADKKGKPQDMQNASVDVNVKPQGKLVIWLMGHSAPLFERLNSYGLHAIQVHYANKWFGIIPPARRDDGKTLGDIRLEASIGEDRSDLVSIPQPDSIMERSYQFVKWLSKEHPAGKWEQFISEDGKGLRWEKVIVSGASHGATTSARFAKLWLQPCAGWRLDGGSLLPLVGDDGIEPVRSHRGRGHQRSAVSKQSPTHHECRCEERRRTCAQLGDARWCGGERQGWEIHPRSGVEVSFQSSGRSNRHADSC
jgi:hypothetical protein